MKLNHLQVFLEICKLRSIRKAAESLGISQPSLSKIVQKLEQEAGVPLLHRLPRGVEPNIYGQTLQKHAKFALAELNHAKEIINGIYRGSFGSIRIGASTTAAHTLLPITIERIQAAHQDTEVWVVEDPSSGKRPPAPR